MASLLGERTTKVLDSCRRPKDALLEEDASGRRLRHMQTTFFFVWAVGGDKGVKADERRARVEKMEMHRELEEGGGEKADKGRTE